MTLSDWVKSATPREIGAPAVLTQPESEYHCTVEETKPELVDGVQLAVTLDARVGENSKNPRPVGAEGAVVSIRIELEQDDTDSLLAASFTEILKL